MIRKKCQGIVLCQIIAFIFLKGNKARQWVRTINVIMLFCQSTRNVGQYGFVEGNVDFQHVRIVWDVRLDAAGTTTIRSI